MSERGKAVETDRYPREGMRVQAEGAIGTDGLDITTKKTIKVAEGYLFGFVLLSLSQLLDFLL